MSRVLKIVLIAIAVLVLVGLAIPFIMQSRMESNRVSCQNHLRQLGLFGVRHASIPGVEIPVRPRDELPPGTFLNPMLSPEERMSWYVYVLNVLNEGAPIPETKGKHRPPAGLADLLRNFDGKEKWDAPPNASLANYRLTTAICPAQVPEFVSGKPVNTNYIASGGLGRETPSLPIEAAGQKAGAYWYDGPTPDSLIKDGLSQTAQIVETNSDLGPWLRGGPSTLRGLDVGGAPYLGAGRQFGGCHPGGCYVSMADGSVQFIKDTIDAGVFRAMLTRAGGPVELNLDFP
jgi:prepilin-type processing-associated H-X9-DG protein